MLIIKSGFNYRAKVFKDYSKILQKINDNYYFYTLHLFAYEIPKEKQKFHFSLVI